MTIRHKVFIGKRLIAHSFNCLRRGRKMRVQETVKKETLHIAVCSVTMTVLMWIAFFLLHIFLPKKISFDYRVILAGVLGA